MKMHVQLSNSGPNRQATKPPETAGNRRARHTFDQSRSNLGPAHVKIRTANKRPKPPETAGTRRVGPNLDHPQSDSGPPAVKTKTAGNHRTPAETAGNSRVPPGRAQLGPTTIQLRTGNVQHPYLSSLFPYQNNKPPTTHTCRGCLFYLSRSVDPSYREDLSKQ